MPHEMLRKAITEFREKKGINKKDTATILKIHRVTLSRLESGIMEISPEREQELLTLIKTLSSEPTEKVVFKTKKDVAAAIKKTEAYLASEEGVSAMKEQASKFKDTERPTTMPEEFSSKRSIDQSEMQLSPPVVEIAYTSVVTKSLYEKNGGIKTEGSVGFDLVAANDTVLLEGNTYMIDLGLIVKPPAGYRITIYPRSSTFSKFGLVQTNSVGVIDPDYCGELDVLKWPCKCIERSATGKVLKQGTPIAQMVLEKARTFTTTTFVPNKRSRGGFGSTDEGK